MVLLAGTGPESGGALCVSPQPRSPPRDAQAGEDPADYEEYEDFSRLPDTSSVASDDSFYPPLSEEGYRAGSAERVSEEVPEDVPEAATLLRAACSNDVGLLKALVLRGPRVEAVQETDPNGRVSPPPAPGRGPGPLRCRSRSPAPRGSRLCPGPAVTSLLQRAAFPGSWAESAFLVPGWGRGFWFVRGHNPVGAAPRAVSLQHLLLGPHLPPRGGRKPLGCTPPVGSLQPGPSLT